MLKYTRLNAIFAAAIKKGRTHARVAGAGAGGPRIHHRASVHFVERRRDRVDGVAYYKVKPGECENVVPRFQRGTLSSNR